MDDSLAEVIRLLRVAQAGQPEQALVQADEALGCRPSLGMVYARAVALHCLGDHESAAVAAEQMLDMLGSSATVDPVGPTVAVRQNSEASADLPGAGSAAVGWQSIALSFRACQHMILSELHPQIFDMETTLQDLGHAEAALSNEAALNNEGADGFVVATAHTNLGHGYHALRLYELALPQYEAALEASLGHSADVAMIMAVKSQLNLAELHLNWSVELHRIRETDRARDKRLTAARHAALAHEYASTEDAAPYAAMAALLGACADSSGPPEEVVDRIRDGIHAVEEMSQRESRAFALPFLAWALDRAGRLPEALTVASEACDALPSDATWILTSAAYHTRAALLARSGSDPARAGLAYGDQLAKTMWRQRLRTLHNARSVQILERITLERDRVAVLAHTDPLTGVGNRRAFDVRVAELASSSADDVEVATIVVDVDQLKAVNDSDGHEAGDLTLQAVAGALTNETRATDLVARLGGDEFVVLAEVQDRTDAAALATRMIDAISTALGSAVTVSVGVATAPASETGTDLLRRADRAMYAAKRAGRAPERKSGVVPIGTSLTG